MWSDLTLLAFSFITELLNRCTSQGSFVLTGEQLQIAPSSSRKANSAGGTSNEASDSVRESRIFRCTRSIYRRIGVKSASLSLSVCERIVLVGHACQWQRSPSVALTHQMDFLFFRDSKSAPLPACYKLAVPACPFANSQCGVMEEPESPSALGHLVLTFCTRHFDALDFVRVSGSSKYLGQLCQDELRAANGQLLHTVIRRTMQACYKAREDLEPPPLLFRQEGTGVASENISNLRCKAMLQLVQMSTTFLSQTNQHSAETAKVMLATPNVPLILVKALVYIGLAVGYAEVVAVARKGGRGVGVYVKACYDLGIVVDIPPYILHLCFKLVRL